MPISKKSNMSCCYQIKNGNMFQFNVTFCLCCNFSILWFFWLKAVNNGWVLILYLLFRQVCSRMMSKVFTCKFWKFQGFFWFGSVLALHTRHTTWLHFLMMLLGLVNLVAVSIAENCVFTSNPIINEGFDANDFFALYTY